MVLRDPMHVFSAECCRRTEGSQVEPQLEIPRSIILSRLCTNMRGFQCCPIVEFAKKHMENEVSLPRKPQMQSTTQFGHVRLPGLKMIILQ